MNLIKKEYVCRNKNVVKDGYTKKMLEVIAEYGGKKK
jgi:hypothetical protein